MTIDPAASRKQLQASDPGLSAWVNANAGSGKTHVLVDRVIRLMLDGTEPSRIMCLTFTKAAAAEMSARLFGRLSAWVSLDDAKLRQSLAALGIAGAEPDLLLRARRLFTRALETPGGLKIQTIHAFCERVLQLFPVEAGVVPRFEVLDDQRAAELLRQAQDRTLSHALLEPDSDLGRAFDAVVERVQADGFAELMRQILGQRAALRDFLGSEAGIDAALDLLRHSLALDGQVAEDQVRADAAIDRGRYDALAAALASGSKTDGERAADIRRTLADPAASLLDFEPLFLTSREREPKKLRSIATQPVVNAQEWIAAFVAAEQERLVRVLAQIADLERLAATRALLSVGRAILEAYEQAKRRQGAYDFEDLIIRTGELLSQRPDAAWVLYKLDGGIEHLLVDEAQDTSPAQWRIVQALTEEFFAGSGRYGGKVRTIFAVGDRKQSIYSFQGADPDMFEVVHGEFKIRVGGAGQLFEDVALTVSFRSTAEILQAVDTVFATDSPARRGLDGRTPSGWLHQSNRPGEAGLVELWPLIEPEDDAEPEPWTAPVDREPARSPRRRLARRLAQTIKSWIGRRVIAATGKLVGPEDILVLVRSRNGFFDALIRELRQADVPVAGADRLKLIDSIAVLDLLALARFCLMPEDDHALACILKSPVLAAPFTEDQVMNLAIGRGEASLWQALRGSDAAHCRAAAAQLGRLAAHAATARAFEFFSGVLMQARLRFLSRLGSEANDALDALLDAALAYEQNHAASLAGFVNWFETGGVEIKRNMEQAAGEVRIMTVHGAKGLEAPIVILPDTASMPDSHTESPLVMVEAGNSGIKLPLWKLPKRFESAAFRTLRARVRDSRDDEYQRLLYVAMTRARDELYICGYRGIQQPKNGCWHETASRALRPVMREVEDGESRLWRLGPDPQYRDAAAAVRVAAGPLPEWIGHPHTEDLALPEPLAVSALARREAAPAAPPERLNRGIAIHRILQRLPGLEEGARTAEARRMAAAAGLDPALGDDLAALTEAPGLRHLFAADGLSEVPLAAALPDLGLTVTGRIDRLILGGDGIIAVDFKTTADPPASPGAVNPGDLVQLACYRAALRRIHPGAPVSMALLHTETKSLMVLPDSLLDQALDQIAVNRP